LTGKIERDLQAAKATIDLLRMLREKTKGNLSDREQKAFNALLGGVQLNYVDELKAEAEKPKEKPEEKPPEKKEEGAAAEKERAEEQAPEEEKPAEEKVDVAAEGEDEPSPTSESESEGEKTGKRKKTRRGKRSGL
jgi:hypothetical protein